MKLKKSITRLISNSNEEWKETKKLMVLIWKAKKEDLTPEEKEYIKEQSLDLVKLTVLGALFLVPFSGILIILLVKTGKRFGFHVLPSSFNKEENGEESNNQ